jgi:hypothetical protein
MRNLIRAALLASILGHLWIEATPAAFATETRKGCRRGDGVRIQDLDMSPDPLLQGQRVREWKLRIRLEGRREGGARARDES